MKINFICRKGAAFPWSMGQGMENALKELGHEVNTFIAEKDSVRQIPLYDKFFEFIKSPCDLILVMGGGDKYYPFYTDCSVREYVKNMKVPTVTYLMESMKTRTITRMRYEKSVSIWSHVWTVDETEIEDLKNVGGKNVKYAPGWIDENIFKPKNVPIKYDTQFIGWLHDHRLPYMEYFRKGLGTVNNKYETVEDYVRGINETKILIAFPSVFTGFTQRVTETLACGKLLLHPTLSEGFKKSKELFKDRENIVFYKTMEEGVALAKYYLEHEEERKQIELNARKEILNKHTIKARVKEFIMV